MRVNKTKQNKNKHAVYFNGYGGVWWNCEIVKVKVKSVITHESDNIYIPTGLSGFLPIHPTSVVIARRARILAAKKAQEAEAAAAEAEQEEQEEES